MFKPTDPYEMNIKKRMNDVCNVRDYIKAKPNKYKKIFKYASEHWNDLVYRARYDVYGENCVSVADQIQAYTDCPYFVAEDVANSISISRAVSSK